MIQKAISTPLRTLGAVLLLLASGGAAHACSLVMTMTSRGTGPFIVFTAAPDTVAVPVPSWYRAAEDSEAGPTAFGQIVRVTRLGGDSSGVPRRALRRSGGRAVLVPWSTTPSCAVHGWGDAGARWVRSSAPAFVSATLRPRSEWAAGLPTFDVRVAYLQPYPMRRGYGLATSRSRRGTRGNCSARASTSTCTRRSLRKRIGSASRMRAWGASGGGCG